MQEDLPPIRCAIYTRKSTSNRLESEFNSLITQREICSAYVRSQAYKSWAEIPKHYDDGGKPGSDLDRPALTELMGDIEQDKVDAVVIYKIDRLTRSLADFVRLVDIFERRDITLVSVSQAFDTSDSMGRMILNILLTFSQFEREMISERVRDSLRARKRFGKIHGGKAPFGYVSIDDELKVDPNEAAIVRFVYDEYLRTERYSEVIREIEESGFRSTVKKLAKGGTRGGGLVTPSLVYFMLQNPIYKGEIPGHRVNHTGRHEAIIDREIWDRVQDVVARRTRPKPGPKQTNHFLAGLMRDELGRTMYVDIQRKAGKVHTYYSSTDARWSRKQYIKAYRTNAGRLDKLFVAIMAEFFADRARLRKALQRLGLRGGDLEKLAQAGDDAAPRIEATPPEMLRDVVSALVIEVELGKEHIAVELRPQEIRRYLNWNGLAAFRGKPRDWPLSNASYHFDVEVRALSPEKTPIINIEPRRPSPKAKPIQGLVRLISEARKAQSLVAQHREKSIDELARQMGVRKAQFGKLLRINYLTPDIVIAILDGTQPVGLNRQSVMRASIPTDWGLQRRMFGFSQPERTLPPDQSSLFWRVKSSTNETGT
ncbi:MAG: recombinase family protein [Parvularcula sp.]|jgi:DNA invertase Pin-like site-specific DNA recombinase|nr:recombinase family protein [Parvularcula sp.]